MKYIQGEVWMPVPGFDGKYLISNLGKVLVCYRNGIRKPQKPVLLNSGYLSYNLYNDELKQNKPIIVSTLVMALFGPHKPDNSYVIGYKDNDFTNCSIENLYWKPKKPSNTNKPHKVIITEQGEIKEFRSFGEVARYIGCSITNVKRYLNTGKYLTKNNINYLLYDQEM